MKREVSASRRVLDLYTVTFGFRTDNQRQWMFASMLEAELDLCWVSEVETVVSFEHHRD